MAESPAAVKSFEQRRQILLRQMLFHTCIGHPVSAWLSRFGARSWAERIHYVTLPARARRRWSFEIVKFQHDPRLFSMDVLWVPLASIAVAFGYYAQAAWVWSFGPTAAAIELGACGYASYECNCKCGCTELTYEYDHPCWTCESAHHATMSGPQIAKVKARRKRREKLEDALDRLNEEEND